MKTQMDDPRLTAYALGELDGEERVEMEALVASSAEARESVEDVRRTAALLEGELAKEPVGSLGDAAHQRIEARMMAGRIQRWVGYAVAASIGLLVGIFGIRPSNSLTPPVTIPSELAKATTNPSDDSKGKLAMVIPEINFDATPLNEVVEKLREWSGLNIVLNWAALEAAAIDRTTEVTLRLRNVSTEKAMSLILDEVGGGETELAFVDADNVVEVSTMEDLGRRVRPGDAQPTETLMAVASGGRRVNLNEFWKDQMAEAGLGGGGGGGGGGGLFGGGGTAQPSESDTLKAAKSVDASDVWVQVQENNTTPKQFSASAGRGGGRGISGGGGRRRQSEMALPAHGNQPPQPLSSEHFGVVGGTDREDGWVYMDVDNDNGTQNMLVETTQAVPWQHEEPPAFDLDKIREYRGRSPVYPENTGESYDGVVDNPFLAVLQNPLSTFSIDVDTASYANIRRMLNCNQLPPAAAVRIEEMVNYFSYDYPQPEGDQPFSVNIETASCPWSAEHRLIRVGLKGREIPQEKRLPCNLVFLIDVSGSMDCENKLPLVKQGLAMLVQQLAPEDRVAMVVYAGASGLALASTPVSQKDAILSTIDHLEAGGSTNGGEGIQLAYKLAGENFNKEGVNRVILATDGDFNVGVTDQKDLVKLVEEKARGGVFLSVLGFGMGNYKDATLEKLADKGNGNYAYIDTFAEAKKVLVDQMGGTLVTIAKDVKIQIEFNPGQVAAYRLIGYENRILAAADFNNDKKDAGEIGAGHTVTALYEIVPTSASTVGVDPLKYQPVVEGGGARRDSRTSDSRTNGGAGSDELMTLKLRYKRPDGDTSKLIESPVKDSQRSFDDASDDLKFAASVAAFGMLLRNSPHKGDLTYDAVLTTATRSMGKDASGYRAEFVDLVRKAKGLSGRP